MEKLTQYMARNGLTQEAFARRMGVNKSTVHRWLTGKMRPSYPQMIAIAKLTNRRVPLSAWERLADGGSDE